MLTGLRRQVKRASNASIQTAAAAAIWSVYRWLNGRPRAGNKRIARYLSSEHKRLQGEYEDRKRREGEKAASEWYVGEAQKLYEAVDALQTLEARRGFMKAVRRLKEEGERP